MTPERTLFDELARDTAPARASDPETSQEAARLPFQRRSQRHLLLWEYECARTRQPPREDGEGLTDEEAAYFAQILRGCPWKRCSELREQLLIAPTPIERKSSMGASQQVCKITGKGRAVLDELGEPK